jgi:hypothetical protein
MQLYGEPLVFQWLLYDFSKVYYTKELVCVNVNIKYSETYKIANGLTFSGR